MEYRDFFKNMVREMRIIPIPMITTQPVNKEVIDSDIIRAMTFNTELNNLGYTLKPKDVIAFAKYVPETAKAVLNCFKDAIGDVKAKPMYPNFPTQVMNMDEAIFRFHQMLHYFSTYGVEYLTGLEVSKGWLPDVEDTEKTVSDYDLLDKKVVELMTMEDAVRYSYKIILSMRERCTLPQLEIIRYDIECGVDTNIEVAFKENMYELFKYQLTNGSRKVTEFKFCQHTGDIWKCVNYLKDNGLKLRTSEKKFITRLFESYPIEDFETNLILSNKSAENIKYMLNWIDFDTFSRSAAHKESVRKLRNNELRSWEGKAKQKIFSEDTEAVKFIAKRPGMMLRWVTLLLRNGFAKFDIMNGLLENVDKLSTQTIMTLSNHFSKEDVKRYDGGDYDTKELSFLRILFTSLVTASIGNKDIPEFVGKKIYVNMDNYDTELSSIECNDKSEEGGYIRSGLAYKIPDGVDIIRFFVYWNDKQRVDLDLHGACVDKDDNDCLTGWNSSYKNECAVFSGDITHSDAAEFIDIDLDKVKYARFNINSYTGQHFKDIDEVFIGMMAVKQLRENVKLYDPKNCFFTHFFKSDFKTINYGYVDGERRCLVFVGKEGACYDTSNLNAPTFNLKQYLSALLTKYNTVDNKEEADLILTMEKSDEENSISLLDNNFFFDRKTNPVEAVNNIILQYK